MADNTTLSAGTGGDVIRDKDRAGVKTQIVAVDLNPAGAETLMSGAMPVTDNGGSLTVDGVFFQATQPVSGTVTANAGAGPFPVSDNAGSLTVDAPVGTPVATRLSDGAAFYNTNTGAQLPAALVGGRLDVNIGSPATLPVSLATNTPDVTDRDARLLGRAKLLDSTGAVIDPATKGQLPAALVGGRLSVDASGVAVPVTDNASSLTVDAPVGTPVFARLSDGAAALVGQKTMANSLPAVLASDQSAISVTPPTLTKGTQGATGFSTQELKNAGRVGITITGFQVAGIITTEALFAASLVRAADGVTAAAAAQHTVTAAKRFCINNITVTVKNTAAAAGTSKLALRYRPAGGTVAITDSIVAILDIGSNNATANNYIGPYVMDIPDGFEMVASATYGFTNLSSAVTMLHTITVIGFEY